MMHPLGLFPPQIEDTELGQQDFPSDVFTMIDASIPVDSNVSCGIRRRPLQREDLRDPHENGS